MRTVAQFFLCCLVTLPAIAQRGGGMHGGGVRGSGIHGGFTGGVHHGGFVGSGYGRGSFGSGRFAGAGFGGFGGYGSGGFRHGFYPRHRFFYGAGFGFLPYYGYPFYTGWNYPYPYSDYSYSPYYDYGYSPSPPVAAYPSDPAPPAEYYAPEPPVRPAIRAYPEPAPSQKYETPIYLIAFQNQENIRATQAYWVEGSTLHYITLQREHKQAPLDSVDRAFTNRLNRERRVDFRLPE